MDDRDRALARRSRTVALVMAAAMVLWLGAQVLGARLGLPPALAFVFDAVALVAFGWALYVTFQIWQARRNG
jgi:uncharacterized membrane-anchored protein